MKLPFIDSLETGSHLNITLLFPVTFKTVKLCGASVGTMEVLDYNLKW